MSRAEHWTARADRVDDPVGRYIGECDNGWLWVPSRRRKNWWDRRLSLWRPTHWPYWLRSRLTRKVAWLERLTAPE